MQTSGSRVNVDDITIYGRTQEPSYLKGDVNGDGEVNIADVNVIINIIQGGNADENTLKRADVNDDGEIGIADINLDIDLIMGS